MMRRAPFRICPKPRDALLWISSPKRVSLLASWIRFRRCWNGRGRGSAETDSVWVYETRKMLTDGEHFLYFLNLLPALNALVFSARLNDKKMRLLTCFSSRVLLAKNLLGSLFYVVEDFSGYRVLVLLTTVLRNKAIIG